LFRLGEFGAGGCLREVLGREYVSSATGDVYICLQCISHTRTNGRRGWRLGSGQKPVLCRFTKVSEDMITSNRRMCSECVCVCVCVCLLTLTLDDMR
jgi:hypothetical protein